jgi:hypothetical protein
MNLVDSYCTWRVAALVVAIGLTGSWSAGGPLPANEQALAARAASLIPQLGHEEFARRQQASRELEELGVAAKQALLAGLQSQDAEVRARCRRILGAVLDLDLQNRLAQFSKDAAGETQPPLPGWERYRRDVGDDAASRALFVQMLRAEPHLFEAAEGDPRSLGPLLQQRCDQLQQRSLETNTRGRQAIEIGSVAALFFIGSQNDVPVTDNFVSYLHTFSYQPAFRNAVAQADKAPPLRRILGLWISRPAGSVNAYQNFMLSLQFGLKEGLDSAITMLRDGGAQPHMAQYAMLLVGRFADRDAVPLVLPFLNDTNFLGSYNVNDKEVRTELRDVALAVLVHLTEQDHASYGFDHLQKSSEMLFQPVTAGFTNPNDREAALARWSRWAMANLKP